MTRERSISIALSVAVVLAAVLAAWAVLTNATSGSSDSPGGANDLPPMDPTTSLVPAVRPPGDAMAELAKSSPGLTALVDAVLAESAAAVLERVPSRVVACDAAELMIRGTTWCERNGLPAGRTVDLVAVNETLPGFVMERREVEGMVHHLIDGRDPRLDLVATRDDGRVILVFGIEPRPAVAYPSNEPAGGGDVVAVKLVVSAGVDVEITSVEPVPEGSPPLEFVRYDEHHGIHDYDIVGVSEEFMAREKASHAEIEEHRSDPPITAMP